MKSLVAIIAAGLIAGCTHSDTVRPEHASSPRAAAFHPAAAAAEDGLTPEQHELYAQYQGLRRSIDAELPQILQGNNPSGFNRVIYLLGILDTNVLLQGERGRRSVQACLAEYEVVRVVNATARQLLWAGRTHGHGYRMSSTEEEGSKLQLGHLIGRTQFSTMCGSYGHHIQASGFTRERDGSGYDPVVDEALWARYTAFLERVDVEVRTSDPIASARDPTAVPELEGLATIAEHPELSCAHAERIRSHTNSSAAALLAFYHPSLFDQPPVIDSPNAGEITIRLADVIARTEARYVCSP